ncbi:MAG TPA: hypothetical protein DCY94_01735 [Firmicutes bacterium]|nr:hypothetical protein [Bacillota bacterium]
MIRELLETLESAGYSAYVVGGYTRDMLLGLSSYDIDIATSAPTEVVSSLFDVAAKDEFGCVSFERENYHIEVTTYRIEKGYEDRKPTVLYFTDDILCDLQRRDFTINAICMDSKGEIYDPLDGQKDLKNGIIRAIGNIEEKMTEDPLRMLRAIRFSLSRSFSIESELKEFIKEHVSLLGSLSSTRIKRELDEIFSSSDEYIDTLEYFGILEIFNLKPHKDYVYTKDTICSWSEFDYPDSFQFKKSESILIKDIKTIVKQNRIDALSVFSYGLNACTKAGKILGIEEEDIRLIYENLPIKDETELAIDGEVISILTGAKREKIGMIKKDLLKRVISGNLPNREIDIKNYIVEKWK